MIKAVAHAVTHAKVLELRLREQLVTHAAHFKFQSLMFSIRQPSTLPPPPSTHKMKIEEATSAKDSYEFQDTNTKF